MWRHVVNKRNGYQLIVLHVIYFFFAIVLLFGLSLRIALLYVGLELVFTTVPFLIFLVPFRVFSSLSDRKLKWHQLFRFYVIWKLQIFPIILLSLQVGRRLDIEYSYVVLDNLLTVFLIGLIVLFPLVIKISFLKKITWIVSNYLFFLIVVVVLASLLPLIIKDFTPFEKIILKTPQSEYLDFATRQKYISTHLVDNRYLILVETDGNKKHRESRNQFVTTQVMALYSSAKAFNAYKDYLMAYSRMSKSDSSFAIKHKFKYRDTAALKMKFNREKLDSLHISFTKDLDAELARLNELKESAIFKTNKSYFNNYYLYLSRYYQVFRDPKAFDKGLVKYNKESITDLNSNNIIVLCELDTSSFANPKLQYLKLEADIQSRTEQSFFLAGVLFYPLFEVLDLFNLI